MTSLVYCPRACSYEQCRGHGGNRGPRGFLWPLKLAKKRFLLANFLDNKESGTSTFCDVTQGTRWKCIHTNTLDNYRYLYALIAYAVLFGILWKDGFSRVAAICTNKLSGMTSLKLKCEENLSWSRNILKKYVMMFRVWILWSRHAGCCETWEKRKKIRAARRVFLAFRKSSYFFYKITTVVILKKTFGGKFPCLDTGIDQSEHAYNTLVIL